MTSRPPEIEQWSNARLVHPVSARLARLFVAAHISANQVSILGLAAVIAAAAQFAGGNTLHALAGALLLFLSHVLDGADGIVARATGSSSRLGEIIDGICDYLGYAALYCALGVVLSRAMPLTETFILLAAAVASHILQANLYESRRRQYCYRRYGTAWIGGGGAVPKDAPLPLDLLARIFLAISAVASGENRRLVAEVERRPALQESYGGLKRRHVKLFAVLSQNVKSAAFALAMLAGCAACYVVFVVVILNGLMLLLRFAERRDEEQFLASG